MRKIILFVVFFFAAQAEAAPEISGVWQGGEHPQRVLKIQPSGKGYKGTLYNLGDEAPGSPRNNEVSAVRVSGQKVSFSLDKSQGDFEGELSADGKTLAGTWKTLYGGAQPLAFNRPVKGSEWAVDQSPHKVHFITVQSGVNLEVLDWGGSGAPLIFLAGLGSTGHEFDSFAPRFSDRHHVYAITRRGFGASSSPGFTDENYDADRLADDVAAVMSTLKIRKAYLVGHSIAGQELSSMGSRHPENVAGLIYLEALYPYAFYNPEQPELAMDSAIVRRNLDRMFDLQPSPARWRKLIEETQRTLGNLQKSLQDSLETLGGPELPIEGQKPEDLAGNKIIANPHAYTAAPVPVLAILALPRRCQPNCDKPFMQRIMAADNARVDLFEKQAPEARVVKIPNASHFIFRSNANEVENEMNSFMNSAP